MQSDSAADAGWISLGQMELAARGCLTLTIAPVILSIASSYVPRLATRTHPEGAGVAQG